MEPIKLISIEAGEKLFQITAYTHTNHKYIIACAQGKELANKNKLKELQDPFETLFLNRFRKEIDTLRGTKTKFIFCIDISDFPFISCRIDTNRPDFPESEKCQFSDDIIRLWDNYDSKKIIIVIVNIYLPHSGVKCYEY